MRPALGEEPDDPREGKGARSELGGAAGEGDGQLRRVEPAVVGDVQDSARRSGAKVRSEPLGLRG
jgi:hypothetical protein